MDEERKGTTMSVFEMRRLLGIKKTESFWLINKHYFKTILVKNRRRIDIESFEEWYANQVKHKKVDGPPPGAKLREKSYSPQDIAEILDVQIDVVYSLIRKYHIPTILVDDWMRVPKEEFEKWYAGQGRYRITEDRERDRETEENSLSLPEIARELGVKRDTVYSIVKGKKNREQLEIVVVAEKKRVTRESFERWYAGQHRYIKVRDRDRQETAESF